MSKQIGNMTAIDYNDLDRIVVEMLVLHAQIVQKGFLDIQIEGFRELALKLDAVLARHDGRSGGVE